MRKKIHIAILCLTIAMPSATCGENLMPNGNFESLTDDWFAGWKRLLGHSLGKQGNNHWLVLSGKYAKQQHTLKIPEGTKALQISCRMRFTDVVKGRQSFQDARLAMEFLDAKGRHAGKWPHVFHGDGTTKWTNYSRSYQVPKDAVYLRIGPANFGGSGKLEIDDIVVTSDQEQASPQTRPAPAVKRGAIGTNLLPNADLMDDEDGNGWPDQWVKRPNVALGKDGAVKTWIIDGKAALQAKIPLHPDYAELTISYKMRVTNVVAGEKSWHSARVALEFKDSSGRRAGSWPKVFSATGSGDWKEYKHTYAIPKGATLLLFNPCMLGNSGKAEFSEMKVILSKVYAPLSDRPKPEGASLDPTLEDAWRLDSATRGKVCLNGLWRFFPVQGKASAVAPEDGQGWGWFKVPGCWPTTKFIAQNWLLPDRTASTIEAKRIEQAWYQRRLIIPPGWKGRVIEVDFTMLQTHARVFVDNKEAGSLFFPGGKVNITRHSKPGTQQVISILVTARPLAKGSQTFMAAGRVFNNKASVKLRGITGDLFLLSRNTKEHLRDLRIITSTRKKSIQLTAEIAALSQAREITARISDQSGLVKTFSRKLSASDLDSGRIPLESAWNKPKLWDTDSPQNMYKLVLQLKDAQGNIIDETVPESFGFREFWINGRDFYLNGKRIHLRALTTDNITSEADLANYQAGDATIRRMQDYGFNFLITHNYGFGPGSVSYMDSFFKATDDRGMLASFSLPHASAFDWRLDAPEVAAEYRELCRYLIRFAQNHPSIVTYTTCHNAAGYKGDQNPLHMDGRFDPDKNGSGREKIRKQALITARIAKQLDPTRPVYHHSSGNLGDMHTNNIYLNWAPIQERNDWLEHWSTSGVKPVFFVEWGLPHLASYSSYRGPFFIWRTTAQQHIWDAEYAAPYLGDTAYTHTKERINHLRHEDRIYRKGPSHFGWLSKKFRTGEKNYIELQSIFAQENWKAHRAWGLSATLPWDQSNIWTYTGKAAKPIANANAYKDLGKPGIAPDQIRPSSKDLLYLYAPVDKGYQPTSLGKAFQRWNRPLIAYIGGGPKRFTEKGHNFAPGQPIRKQVVIVNDTRHEQKCTYTCRFGSKTITGDATVQPGDKALIPITFAAPMEAGRTSITLELKAMGIIQDDQFQIDTLPSPATPRLEARLAVYDPKGLTRELLKQNRIPFRSINARQRPELSEILVIGREALSNHEHFLGLSSLPQGQRIIMMEQQSSVLSDRLGFRVQERGIRRAFITSPNSPVFEGLLPQNLHNWQGSSTLLAPHVDGATTSDPTWKWCGFINTRVWRCGNYGSLASVIIEKPNRGNFRPLLSCGFDHQYTPLMEYRDGKGLLVFSQLDISGRSEVDTAARRILVNLLKYVDNFKPSAPRTAQYMGARPGSRLMADLGIGLATGRDSNSLLVLGPGAPAIPELKEKVEAGLNVLCIGLSKSDIQKQFGTRFPTQQKEVVSTTIKDMSHPVLAGINNADLHWRGFLKLDVFAEESGHSNQALKIVEEGMGTIVLCQTAPWTFDYKKLPHLRTSFRRNVHLLRQLLINLGADSKSPLTASLSDPEIRRNEWPLPAEWVGIEDRRDQGRDQQWFTPAHDDSGWKPIQVPGSFDLQFKHLANYDGLFWYRLRFPNPGKMTKGDMLLDLGRIDDESWVWLNGRFLGEITKKTNPRDYWSVGRAYKIDRSLLKDENVLVVRVNDIFKAGGMMGTPRIYTPGPWNNYYIQKVVKDDDPYRYYRW